VTGWDVDQYAARALLDTVPVGITIHDSSQPDAPVVYVNDRFCSLTGYDREAVVGAPLDLLAPTTDAPRCRRMSELIDATERASAVVETTRADGSTVPNRVRAAPLGDGHTLLVHEVGDTPNREVTHDRVDALPGTRQESGRDAGPVDALATVDLVDASEACWRTVGTDSAELSVQTDRRIRAEPNRLARLLSALFYNAVEHGDAWHVTLGELGGGFYVGDDGSGIPEVERASLFDTDGGLTTCQRVAEFHGWELDVGENREGGARVEVSGVDLVR